MANNEIILDLLENAEFERAKQANTTLAKKPDDPEANFTAGKYLCLVKGDWDKGLPLLAKGSDAKLKELAQKELAGPKDAAEQAAVGDGWWAQETRNWWEDHYRAQREPNHQWTFVDFAVGNASLSRSLLDRCGGFDPTFPGPRGREDWELGIRILDAGGRLRYVAEARGDHYLDASFETALRNSRSDARSELEVARPHPQVIGHLSIVNVADAVARGDRRVLNAYRHPGQGQAAARGAHTALPLLERLNMRKTWRWLAFALLRHAFVAGLVDALPREDALLELVGSWRNELPALKYEFGGAFSPMAPTTAAADLVVTSRGQTVAALSPVEPGQQWQWSDVLQRVAAQSQLVQEAEVHAQLAQLAQLAGLEARP